MVNCCYNCKVPPDIQESYDEGSSLQIIMCPKCKCGVAIRNESLVYTIKTWNKAND